MIRVFYLWDSCRADLANSWGVCWPNALWGSSSSSDRTSARERPSYGQSPKLACPTHADAEQRRSVLPNNAYSSSPLTLRPKCKLTKSPHSAWIRIWGEGQFNDLIEAVESIAPYTLLTSPSLSSDSVSGKVHWIYKHFPPKSGIRFRRFLIGKQKNLLAAPNRILLDDAENNVESFRTAGGIGILFPQVWNRNYRIANPLTYVRQKLEGAAGA